MQAIIAGMCEHDRDVIHQSKVGLADMHHTVGRYIRNSWSLWERETALVQHYIARFGLAHADDLSGLMLEQALCEVRGQAFDIEAKVRHYLEHWREQGVDPITLERRDAP